LSVAKSGEGGFGDTNVTANVSSSTGVVVGVVESIAVCSQRFKPLFSLIIDAL
jgi:hypothetical protein